MERTDGGGRKKQVAGVVTVEEAARRFREEHIIVIPTVTWEKVAADEARRPVIGWNIGVDNGPIRAGDHDPDND